MGDEYNEEYFQWLMHLVLAESDESLLRILHETPFRYSMRMDGHRAKDGEALRYRFDSKFESEEPCSVLEMMVALAHRVEEQIVYDPETNVAADLFQEMLNNLGLDQWWGMDHYYIYHILDRFLDRKYEKDGTGGLFVTKNPDLDMRKLEIWYQMMDHLNEC